MELIHCKFCGSNLVNLIATTIKHDDFAERNINIKKGYITLKEPQAIKTFLRCYNCSKISELVLKNQSGCCSWELLKSGDKEPRNEIISVEEGGRFN